MSLNAAVPWRSRFVGAGLDVTFRLPVRPWRPSHPTVGGRMVAAAGVPASYIVRRDALLHIVARVPEQDWDTFLAVIFYGQNDGVIEWFPDVREAGDSSLVYLDHPAPGEDWEPTERMEDFELVLEQALVLRSVDGSSIWRPYFPTMAP